MTLATAGACTDGADVNAGVTVNVTTNGADAINIVDELFLLYGANPGEWNNDIYFTIHTYDNYPDLVKEPDSFLLRIFTGSNLNNAVEEFVCSRVVGDKDGYGNNIYLEDILEASEYVHGIMAWFDSFINICIKGLYSIILNIRNI